MNAGKLIHVQSENKVMPLLAQFMKQFLVIKISRNNEQRDTASF